MDRHMAAIDALTEGIAAVAADLPGRLGVFVRYPRDGLEAGYAADDLFPAASVIKISIMAEVYRQAAAALLSLDEPLPLRSEEVTGGAGMLQFLHAGLDLTVADAVELMIALSDNTATNLLIRRVGRDAVNATMDDLGLYNTRTAGAIGRREAPPELAGMSRTTPREMAALLTAIAEGRLVSAAASAAMRRTLEHQVYGDMLPRYLPVTAAATVRVAHKTGALSGVRCDAGIIAVDTPRGARTVVVGVFTADMDDGDLWTTENIGLLAGARVGRLAYDTLLVLTTLEEA